MDSARAHYDDGAIACDDDGLAIQRYYPWGALRVCLLYTSDAADE